MTILKVLFVLVAFVGLVMSNWTLRAKCQELEWHLDMSRDIASSVFDFNARLLEQRDGYMKSKGIAPQEGRPWVFVYYDEDRQEMRR